jgi:hypothetical protein
MGWDILLLAALGGVLIGLLLTLFGGGGSVLATPWLIYVVGLADVHTAIGTSAAAVAVNAATGLGAGPCRAGQMALRHRLRDRRSGRRAGRRATGATSRWQGVARLVCRGDDRRGRFDAAAKEK